MLFAVEKNDVGRPRQFGRRNPLHHGIEPRAGRGDAPVSAAISPTVRPDGWVKNDGEFMDGGFSAARPF